MPKKKKSTKKKGLLSAITAGKYLEGRGGQLKGQLAEATGTKKKAAKKKRAKKRL